MRALACLLILCLLPAAAAGSQPAVLFLADGTAPVGDGHLQAAWPEGNVSSLRIVLPEPLATQFIVVEANGTHLKGPVFAALWPDRGLAENGSTLRASLQVGEETVLEVSMPVSFDPSSLPDPMSFVPPDPTDPQAAALHVVAQAMPQVLTPPVFVYLGAVDIEVPEGAAIALRLEIVPAGPVPIGSVLLKYDSLLTPSYVYMPWWTADEVTQPAPPTAAPAPPQTATPTPTQDAPDPPAAGKESPAGPVALVLLGVGLLAWRRR